MSCDPEKALLRLRGISAAFSQLLHEIGGTPPGGERFGDRHLALANTHFEDAAMRVEKALASRNPGS